MVKVKEEAAMAEPKPAAAAHYNNTNSTTTTAARKPRHQNHSHHRSNFHHSHMPYFYHFSYPTEAADANGSNGASSPAKFYFGPGFEPQTQIPSSYGGAGPSLSQNGSEYVVLFHVHPGVTISFQIGDTFEVLRGR